MYSDLMQTLLFQEVTFSWCLYSSSNIFSM